MSAIHAILLTSVRLFGEALERCLVAAQDICLLKILGNLNDLRQALAQTTINVVLVDVTQDIDFREVSELAAEHPEIAFIALGLQEQASDVIHAGKSGFAGYVGRDASLATLIGAMTDATAGRLSCSGEVASHLLRALFQQSQPQMPTLWANGPEGSLDGLTRREWDVARLVGQGFSNKEIARDLCVSLATVKHHVHHVLEKLRVSRRAQVSSRLGGVRPTGGGVDQGGPRFTPRSVNGP